MLRFITERALQALVVLLVMSALVYGLIGLMPGDPVDLMAAGNPNITPEGVARLRALHGLDQPLSSRYLRWLGAALQGDFGYSRQFHQPVPDVLLPRLLNTLALLLPSLLLALAIAIPAGVHAARRPCSWTDSAINLLSFAGISIPPFWLALLLIMLFAVLLGWLPAGGMGPVEGGPVEGGPAAPLSAMLPYMVMPVLTLTLASVGAYTRHVRAAMREALRQDHIRTARAKGLGEGAVVWRHALRNALIPVVTVLALDIGALVSGALVTETMFGWLGMGRLIYDAIMGNDYNLALVGLLLATAMTLAGNVLADVAYAALDPRISFAGRRT